MPYMISSRPVTGGACLASVCQLVSQNWSAAVSYYFVDNKLTLICLLVTVSVSNTQVIQLIRRDQHL